MSTIELTNKAKDYREIMAMIKELQDEADAIKAAITAEMERTGDDIVQAGIFTVKWTEYTTSRIDATAFKTALPELAQQFTKSSTAKRFQVA